MSENSWQPIETARKDGSPVRTGTITRLSIGGVPLYPLTSKFIDGKWQADFGDRWAPYDPQPSHWLPGWTPQNNAPQTAETQAQSTTSPPLINQV